MARANMQAVLEHHQRACQTEQWAMIGEYQLLEMAITIPGPVIELRNIHGQRHSGKRDGKIFLLLWILWTKKLLGFRNWAENYRRIKSKLFQKKENIQHLIRFFSKSFEFKISKFQKRK